MKKLTKIFKALGDQNRLRIVKMLEVRPLCNCEIQEILGLAGSTVSKHLGLLRDAGILEDERKGKWVIYSLSPESTSIHTLPLLELVGKWLNDDLQISDDLQRVKAMEGKFFCEAVE
ncbi:MAG: metalloregulator ArsR/SmtB family transcription factor [SAR324 cluster bacterium]|nr:metalloregulator ArsR/SmtB family transcription factor [SAR324 cluster bacterium]